MCQEVFLFANTEMYWAEDIFYRGTHTFHMKIPNENA